MLQIDISVGPQQLLKLVYCAHLSARAVGNCERRGNISRKKAILTLRTYFSTNDNMFNVWVALGLVLSDNARSRDNNVDSLHERDPFLLGVASDTQRAAIV